MTPRNAHIILFATDVSMPTPVKIFNTQLDAFIADVATVFPENMEIKTAQNSLSLLKAANPKLVVSLWYEHIAIPYKQQIESGDVEFFVNKNYHLDVLAHKERISSHSGSVDKVMQAIDQIRDPVRSMGAENQQTSMKYIQVLTKLSEMCMGAA